MEALIEVSEDVRSQLRDFEGALEKVRPLGNLRGKRRANLHARSTDVGHFRVAQPRLRRGGEGRASGRELRSVCPNRKRVRSRAG